MPLAQSFSKGHGFRSAPKDITVREDAPEALRYFVLQTAIDLGSGLIDQSQKMTAAAMQIAEK